MAQTPAFARFLPQAAEYLGPLQWVESPTAHGPNRGFAVLYFHTPGTEVGHAVTSGLRFRKIRVVFPQELCCSLLAEQEETAHRILVMTARMILESGAGVFSGTIIPGERPLAPGSEMVGVICTENPCADDEFNVVRDADGKVEMQIISLIPASAAELALAAEHGEQALFEAWEQDDSDVADLTRPSAV